MLSLARYSEEELMGFSIDIVDWCALAPGLDCKEQWVKWSHSPVQSIDSQAQLPKCSQLPMMMARRLNSGSRLAVDCGLALYRTHHEIDAIVFSSRHGELERNYRLLSELATHTAVSPTNFTMSVHNSAVGSLAVIAKSTIVTSSVSAGEDSFQQGLFEVLSLLYSGCESVLYVDFDGNLPDVYHSKLPENSILPPYACAFVIKKGSTMECTAQPLKEKYLNNSALPQSLRFLHGLLTEEKQFTVMGGTHSWSWQVS